jgi:hypothetical protein
MAMIPVIPPDKIAEGHPWREWFMKVQKLLSGVEHYDGHWYLTDGAKHAIVTSAGIQTTSKIDVNTTTATLLYSYTFAANELHDDEKIITVLTGYINAATGAESVTITIKLAGTTIVTLVITPKNATNVGWKLEYEGIVRTTGTSGTFMDYANFRTDTGSTSHGGSTTNSVNTTISNLFEVYATWGAAKAGNEIGCTIGSLRFEH